MKIILCVDNNLGYSFNRRRLSRDRKMREHMLGILRGEGAGLFLNSYSEKSLVKEDGLFTEEELERIAAEPAAKGSGFLESAEESGGWAFVENVDLEAYLDCIDEMMLYRWNRLYLSDLRLSREFIDSFEVAEEESFRGSSHDSITYQRMIRRGKADEQ